MHRFKADFHTPRLHQIIQEYVSSCTVCQRNKIEHLHPAGLLQPLPVPSQIWMDISLDFVEGLPTVYGKSVILTVVDRFSKYAHFIALGHPYSACSVATVFFSEIVRLHGIPSSIVSDRDSVFIGKFWQELFRLAGVKLYSTAFHPQSDGQTKAVNKSIAMYLRCLTGDRLKQWLRWLSWAEYCYNTSFQASLRETPFSVVYGRPPPSIQSYEPGSSRVAAVAKNLQERDEFLVDIRERLVQAQEDYKKYYDEQHRDVEFAVED
ncbi:hypothetical protein GUJ93_ZPchr0005g15817 [Zizania palustris]|uniref:Integrase catalytic domain-containing protein n=1 Tax=Zizania palustris TaxID=103762 RepID=A0A8J5S5S7_ZIZPA|nr:hypothetical protein GUJ93_ZPchr0005g15817 [Zizania palustris]